jgi:hypothetical protein
MHNPVIEIAITILLVEVVIAFSAVLTYLIYELARCVSTPTTKEKP